MLSWNHIRAHQDINSYKQDAIQIIQTTIGTVINYHIELYYYFYSNYKSNSYSLLLLEVDSYISIFIEIDIIFLLVLNFYKSFKGDKTMTLSI